MWNYFLCLKDKNAKAVRREACNTFPSLEREGDHRRWWKVECCMLEQRKAKKYDKKPFYKNFPHPPFNLLLVFLAIRSIHLQMREVNLPVFYAKESMQMF